MKSEFKHPQIFADMLIFCQLYYPLHQGFPKPFRFAVGEKILAESAECLRLIVLANSVNKIDTKGRNDGADYLSRLRASIEVLRGFLLLAWKLRFVSNSAVTELSARLEAMSKQAVRWQQWFMAC